jgi:alpha-tubulin suppressor-like RCC1 family protein
VANDRAYCWGGNSVGQLGDGTTDDDRTPEPVSGSLNFRDVRTERSTFHTCGVTTNDGAYCWGANTQGELGDGTREERHEPTAVVGPT